MATQDLIVTARAALVADSPDAARVVFALHEHSPMPAVRVLLEVASGRTDATDEAQDRAADLAADLVDRDTVQELLAMVIRGVNEHGVPGTPPCDFQTLFAVFGMKESSDADWVAAGEKDESARMPALMRFASVTPRPDRTLAGGKISGAEADAILERVFATFDRLVPAQLGVAYEPGTGETRSALRFWVWGKRAVGFLSAFAEPVGHEIGRIYHFPREGVSPEFRANSRPRAHGRELRVPVWHPPGRYRVHAFLADRPLEHAEMRSGLISARVVATAKVEFATDD